MDQLVVLACVAALLFLLAFIYYLVGGPAKRAPAVVLVGPCGSGKTLLFHRLMREEERPATVSSMRATEAAWDRGDKGASPIALVDFPGHYRLRGGLEAEIARAKTLIFVMDASNALAQSRPAAELLYAVLTSEAVRCASATKRGAPSMLFVCNKSDAASAKTPQRLKLMMMNEIETLRKTSGALDAADDDGAAGERPPTLGAPGQFFSFEKHCPCPIKFVAFSAKNDDLTTITDFVASVSA